MAVKGHDYIHEQNKSTKPENRVARHLLKRDQPLYLIKDTSTHVQREIVVYVVDEGVESMGKIVKDVRYIIYSPLDG